MSDLAKELYFTAGLFLAHTSRVLARTGLMGRLLHCKEPSIGELNARVDDGRSRICSDSHGKD